MDIRPESSASLSLKNIIYGVLFVVLLIGLYYIRNLVFVFLTSIVLASFVDAGVHRLKKLRIGRTLAVVILYFCTLSSLGLFLYFFLPVFVGQMSQFALALSDYLPQSASALHLDGTFSEILTNFETIATSEGKGVAQVAIALFGGLLNVVLLIVISFYLSINEKGIESFLRIVTPQPQEEYVVSLWKRTNRKIGLWFQGQLLLGLLVGVLTYLGLLIFDIKYSLLLAIAAAIMELIPFGIILAAVPAVAAGFASSGTTGALQVAALYAIIQQFENNLIQPLIVQKVVGVSSLVVILSLLVGVQLAGIWGVFLSIPVAVLLTEMVADVEKKKKPLPIPAPTA